MKKSKLSITLVTSFIAAMALTACKDVTKSDEAIVTFKPYGSDNAISLVTNDVYNKYRGTSNGISMFYEKILEVLIRYEFKNGFNKTGVMKYEEIEKWANNQVQEQKDKAKANAKSNKETSYKDEWESILDSYKVEDEAGLKEHFIYEKEKEEMKNWYAGDKDKAEELKAEFIGINSEGKKVDSKVASAMPYHVRHILVKVDEASDAGAKFYKGTISETQAKLIGNIIEALGSGKYTFSQVAKTFSEDGSASSGGDVGIMTNSATSGSLGMVNEFQLGIYTYDNLIDENNKIKDGDTDAVKATKKLIREGLGILEDETDDCVAKKMATTLAEVPYSAFAKIGEYADYTTDMYGNKLANGSATVYPRNVLWNKYLNLHNIFLITDYKGSAPKFKDDDSEAEFATLVDKSGTEVPATATRFKNHVLVDENGNPIIGVRSEYGLHFMVIEKSMYEFAGKNVGTENEKSKLSDYYSTKIPGDDGYNPDSYVGYIVSDTEDYKKRADDVKSKITSFDPTYDYRLYQWLTSEVGTITFSDNAKGLGDDIDKYISALQKNNLYKQEEGLEKVWRTYSELLDVQSYNRAAQFEIVDPTTGKNDDTKHLTRLVSEAVANDFVALHDGSDTSAYSRFAEGGMYYYYA